MPSVLKTPPLLCAPPLSKDSGRTDAANAQRLTAKYRSQIRWVAGWDRWIFWDCQRWRIDDVLQIEAQAKNTAAGLWKQIAAVGNEGETKSDLMSNFARYSNSKYRVVNMVALARSEPGVPITVDELDRNPRLLNVANGTLDLRKGELLPHDRRQFLTKLAPVTFDQEATCDLWIEFLDRIFAGDAELIGYLQRLVGYSLTGDVSEHILPFFYGGGANGKSTFVEVCLRLLGPDYSMKAPPDLLLAKRGESHPTERADLHGKRLVACIETEEGRRLAESLAKELTGGDRIRARRMYRDLTEFSPTHKIWFAGNYKPAITGTDYGIWRRVKLIPFNVTIPETEWDKQLTDKLTAELSGILNWALEGCLDWQANAMQEPEIVRAATKDYQSESDDIGQFIEQHCEVDPSYEARATELFEMYEQNGGELTQKSFGSSLRRRGFESVRITKGVFKGRFVWKGLRIFVPDVGEFTNAEA